jgi:flagellar biogenesis protein FliO
MKKINNIILGVFTWFSSLTVYAADKFEILPDLPEPLAAAQASSVSTVETTNSANNIVSGTAHEPSAISVIFALLFVILLIYLTRIIIEKLNIASIKSLKKQIGDNSDSKVAVISTTALGTNKSLHVVELGGKRLLLGASVNGINLIKDLGTYPPEDVEEAEFSNIEIPNIRIPKIEIPKIEFPNIGFTKIIKKKSEDETETTEEENIDAENKDEFVISDIYEEGPDGIIDKLFTQSKEAESKETKENIEHIKQNNNEHEVDPDEFALYKKYL